MKANKSFHDTSNIKQGEVFYSKNIYKVCRVSKCVICDSKMHWADKCPRKSNYQSVNISEEVSSATQNESESEEINIVLMTEEIDKNEILLLKHPSSQL